MTLSVSAPVSPVVLAVVKSLRERRRSMQLALERLPSASLRLSDELAIRSALLDCLHHDLNTIESFCHRP